MIQSYLTSLHDYRPVILISEPFLTFSLSVFKSERLLFRISDCLRTLQLQYFKDT